jgi:signal transduction histidine kinase
MAELRAGHPLGDAAELDELIAEIPQAVADAQEGIRRVNAIVRSIRDYTHPSQHHAMMDVNRQIRAVAELARNEYKDDAELVLELGDLPLIPGHADEVGCAILNLLVNAAQAMRGGQGPRGKITVTSRATADVIAIDVADTGPGIPIAHRERVFEPFFTTKPIGQGTGQGLAITRAIVVDGHRGTLTLDSELGRGTTFHVNLPIAGLGDAS